MPKPSYYLDYSRQPVKGVFFYRNEANREDCRKLVQDLGCIVLLENSNSITIQTSRSRLKELKERYLSFEDDKAQISSRLKLYFDRILIGGTVQ